MKKSKLVLSLATTGLLVGTTLPLTSCNLFKAKTFEVKFDAQMDGVTVKTQTIKKNETAINPKVEDHNGKSLVGWYKEQACENAYDFESSVTSNITLYGKWVNTVQVKQVNFHCNLEGLQDITTKVEYNTCVHEPKVVDPNGVKAVKAWRKDSLTGEAFDFSTAITSDLELYAEWTDEKHTVTFNIMEEAGATKPTDQVIFYKKLATEPNMPETANHRVVAGWYTEAELTNKFDFSTPITKDLTLYAKFVDASQLLTVSFNDQVTNSTVVTQKVLKGETISPIKNPTWAHHRFIHWYKAGTEGSTAFDFTKPIQENLTLYAYWAGVATYEVKFETGNGTKVSSQDVYEDEMVTIPDNPTKVKSEFVCWCKDEACTDPYDFTTPVKGTFTLYAKWNTHPTILKVYNRETTPSEINTLNLYTGDIKQAIRVDALWSNNGKTETVETDTNNYTITYKSGTTDIVSFDDNHYATAIKAGSAVWTIASKDSQCTNTVDLTINVYDSTTKYLSFTSIDSGNAYEVSASTSATESIPENLVIPSTFNNKPVTKIADLGFSHGEGGRATNHIKTINLPNTITEIGTSAFYDCNALEYINLPEGLTKIGNGAFSNYNTRPGALKSLSFPSTLKTIGDNAFAYQESLTSIYIPNTITTFGNAIFENCSGLSGVSFQDGITAIPQRMFVDCTSIEKIIIPEGVKSLGGSCFSGCTSLSSITLPITLTSIGSAGTMAFSGCKNLKSFTIPMDDNSKYFAVDSSTHEWVTTGNILCKADTTVSTHYSISWIGSNVVDLVVPKEVISLDEECCTYNSTLKTITFEADSLLATISDSAFKGCNALTTLDLSNCSSKLYEIKRQAFFECTSLNSITFPATSTQTFFYLYESCFSGCSALTTVTIPSYIGQIQKYAFNKTGLTKMKFGATTTSWTPDSGQTWVTVDDATEETDGTNAKTYLASYSETGLTRQ